MERFKSILLAVLVIVAMFFSYELLFKGDVEPVETITINNKNVISYKRFFSTLPTRESLDTIPDDDISEFIAKTLSSNLNLRQEKIKIYDSKNHANFKDFSFEKNEGYLVISAFSIPTRLLTLSTEIKISNLPFSSFDRVFIDNKNRLLYLNTDKGVYSMSTRDKFHVKKFSKYILYDDKFKPVQTHGVNTFANIENPVQAYSKSDRQNLAKRFLGTNNIYEIEEIDAYTYSSETASVRLENNGDVIYLRSPLHEERNSNLFDSLVSFKNFIKTSLLSFSNYRILNIERPDNDTFKITFLQGELPHYLRKNSFYEAILKNNIVTSFKYNAISIKPYEDVVRKPEIGDYKALYLKNEDPFFIYNGTSVANIGVASLR